MATKTTREVPASRVADLIQGEEERFRKARPRSRQLWTEAREVMPRGVPSSFQDASPQPIFMERGRGSRVWDVDGNEYVDFHNGFGVMVVGHAHPKIVDAVSRQIALGSHFVEPVMMNVGIVLPDAGYLAAIKETAHNNGALLIFDEVKTGATIAPGGATDRFGVTPDLVALAKAIGGGLPCGAVGGREDVMGVIEEKRVAQMGTFNGNPLTMAASKVTLLEILDAAAYAHFDALAETLQGGLDAVIGENEMPFHVITLAARGGVTYRSQRVRNYRDYLEIDKSLAYLSWLYQCNRGVVMAPGAEENWTLSVQHSVEDVQRYVDNFAAMAKDIRA